MLLFFCLPSDNVQRELQRSSPINISRMKKSKGNQNKKDTHAQSLTLLCSPRTSGFTSISIYFKGCPCPFLLITCSSTVYSKILSRVQAPLQEPEELRHVPAVPHPRSKIRNSLRRNSRQADDDIPVIYSNAPQRHSAPYITPHLSY